MRFFDGDFESPSPWEQVYASKGETEVSWFQESAEPSPDLIARTGATSVSSIIDIGGGASRLVDALAERGFRNITVLDLSQAALALGRGPDDHDVRPLAGEAEAVQAAFFNPSTSMRSIDGGAANSSGAFAISA